MFAGKLAMSAGPGRASGPALALLACVLLVAACAAGSSRQSTAEAQSAIQALNGFQMNGRPLRVNEAQERPQRPRQGGGPFRR